jgi:hypothetical protein
VSSARAQNKAGSMHITPKSKPFVYRHNIVFVFLEVDPSQIRWRKLLCEQPEAPVDNASVRSRGGGHRHILVGPDPSRVSIASRGF